ncbi:MAG TPA: hypothetical protein VFZ01_06690 [Geminicoccaceae bacterium]
MTQAGGTKMMRALEFRLIRTPLAFGLGVGLALVAPFVGVSLIKSLMVRLDEQALVHPDRTVFESGETPTAEPPVRFLLSGRGGTRSVDLLPDHATSFAASIEARLAQQRSAARAEVERTVEAVLAPIEQAAEARVEAYADWYFGWLTSYRLAGVAALSVADHALEARVSSLAAAVSFDLAAHLRRHYEEQVLEPEISAARLQRAFLDGLRRTRTAHAAAIDGLADALDRELLTQAARQDRTRPGGEPRVTVDWGSQLHKLKITSHERGGLDAGLRGALIGASGLIGARGGLALGAGRGAAASLPALAGPAAVRQGTGRGLARIGLSAAGATVAGPLGFAVGLGTGLLVDLAVNRVDEALHRDAFEASVRGSVAATFADLRDRMRDELQRTVDVWFDDAHAALQLQLR